MTNEWRDGTIIVLFNKSSELRKNCQKFEKEKINRNLDQRSMPHHYPHVFTLLLYMIVVF